MLDRVDNRSRKAHTWRGRRWWRPAHACIYRRERKGKKKSVREEVNKEKLVAG